ncbi:MAG: DUF6144 family protein [Huintestinicola sp.]
MNKAARVINNMDPETASAICSEIGPIGENATPLKQARYINAILNAADEMNICITDTMRKCGGCCLSANAVKTAKKLYAGSESIEEFLTMLNDADIGGKNLHLSDGRIIAVYKKCYCNIPKKITGMNKQYCECSAGWYMKLFSEVFEKNVTVKIVDTIVDGADECTFEITDF